MVRGFSSITLGAVLVVAASITGGWGRLEERAFETNATCHAPAPDDVGKSWLWMDNAQHKSPCLTAAYLLGPCVSAGYLVVALPDKQGYNLSPDACSCSWAVYNLLSACTLCQGQQSQIVTWFMWSQNCTGHTSTTLPYPPLTPPDNTTIPYWASINPATWADQRWNGAQAYAQPDGDIILTNSTTLTPTPTPTPAPAPAPKSGNNVGAIAGGVVGGVAIIAVGIALALFLFCRNKQRKNSNKQGQMAEVMGGPPFDPQHARSPSDFSTKTYGSGLGYAPLGHMSSPSASSTNRFPQSPTTFHTHNSSRGSFAHESLLPPTSYPATPPPPAVATPPNVFMTPHGAVSPFTLDRPSTPQETPSNHDSKRAISPTNASDTAGASTRGHMNPPAYSEAPHVHADFSSQAPDQSSIYGSTSIMTTPEPRRPHEKSPSVDSSTSHRSDASATSAGYWTHATTTSLSGAADLLSQMDSTSPSTGPTIPPYAGPGPSTSVQYTRNEKRRPTVMNPSNGAVNGESERQ